MANKTNDMAHTKWMCKYHIVFTPKYRRKAIYNQYKESIRDILKQLCAYKGVEILEGHLTPDHIHMLVSIPPKMSIVSFMGYLKGKSALMIFDKHANLKYKYGNRHFWAEGYYVSTVGLNEAKGNIRWILFVWFVPAILGMIGAGLYFLLVPNAVDTTFAYARTLLGNEGLAQLESNGLSVQMYAVISAVSAITYAPFVNMLLATHADSIHHFHMGKEYNHESEVTRCIIQD